MRRSTPLPPRATSALEILRPSIEGSDGGLSRIEIRSILLDSGFALTEVPVLLEILIQRGYLYEVADRVRVTD